jgi:uncharacterized protein YndB with AHSA1/START domain
MLITLLIAFVVVVAILIVVIAMQPDEFRVQRSASIPTPPAIVFEQVNDLHKWQAWSPWAKKDPNAATTFEGPPTGTGASFTWDSSNGSVGKGRMTITDTRPNELVQFKLDFEKPFAATNTVTFTFKPEGDSTAVTWAMVGKANFLFKGIGLFMNCDKMCGDQFEQGLADMKAVCLFTGKK